MSETLIGVIIGGTFGLLGALLSQVITSWREVQKMEHERLKEIRRLLVGEKIIQSSEVMDLIRSQRKRKWPIFWEIKQPDLSKACLEKVDLRKQNLQCINFHRADLSTADLGEANMRGSDFSHAKLSGAYLGKAILQKADLSWCDLSNANLNNADLRNSNLTGIDLSSTILTGAIMPDGSIHE